MGSLAFLHAQATQQPYMPHKPPSLPMACPPCNTALPQQWGAPICLPYVSYPHACCTPLMCQHSPTHQHVLLLLLAVQGMCGDNKPCLWVDGERSPKETPIGHLPIGTCREEHGLRAAQKQPQKPLIWLTALHLPPPRLSAQGSHRLQERMISLPGK